LSNQWITRVKKLEGLEMERPGERPRTASDWVAAALDER
jgi:hypothetical protein